MCVQLCMVVQSDLVCRPLGNRGKKHGIGLVRALLLSCLGMDGEIKHVPGKQDG